MRKPAFLRVSGFGFRVSGVRDQLVGIDALGCVVVTEAGSYLRLIDFCITQLKAHGPSRTCNESKEEEGQVRSATPERERERKRERDR